MSDNEPSWWDYVGLFSVIMFIILAIIVIILCETTIPVLNYPDSGKQQKGKCDCK